MINLEVIINIVLVYNTMRCATSTGNFLQGNGVVFLQGRDNIGGGVNFLFLFFKHVGPLLSLTWQPPVKSLLYVRH